MTDRPLALMIATLNETPEDHTKSEVDGGGFNIQVAQQETALTALGMTELAAEVAGHSNPEFRMFQDREDFERRLAETRTKVYAVAGRLESDRRAALVLLSGNQCDWIRGLIDSRKETIVKAAARALDDAERAEEPTIFGTKAEILAGAQETIADYGVNFRELSEIYYLLVGGAPDVPAYNNTLPEYFRDRVTAEWASIKVRRERDAAEAAYQAAEKNRRLSRNALNQFAAMAVMDLPVVTLTIEEAERLSLLAFEIQVEGGSASMMRQWFMSLRLMNRMRELADAAGFKTVDLDAIFVNSIREATPPSLRGQIPAVLRVKIEEAAAANVNLNREYPRGDQRDILKALGLPRRP